MSEHPSLVQENDIPYGTGNGRALLLDMLRPDVPLLPARPAVIWVHGGGWLVGERSPNPNPSLALRGFVTASISYRFSDEAIYPAQIHDVKAAIRFLRANASRWGIDPERIGIWGGSAGGHLTALAAVTHGIPALEGEGGNPNESSDVQAAVPLCPPTNFLVDWYAESGYPEHKEAGEAVQSLLDGNDLDDPEIAERARLASPDLLASADCPPILVVHGTLDDLVPVAQGRRFVKTLQELGVDASLLELPQDDHALLSVVDTPETGPSPALQQIIEFFVAKLGPVAQP